jgi:ABC-type uncharacterized transport system substrate-binding protein
MKRIAASVILITASLLGLTGAAGAHPHVFAEARLEVAVAPDGNVEIMRHVWRFDDVFSSTVLLEFDADTDNLLEDPELEEVASVVTDSLAEFNYFQTILVGGKSIDVEPVKDMKALFQDGQLILFFTTHPVKPVNIKSSPSFGVYDPTFYTAIDFTDDSQMVLEGAPANCSHKMVVPDPDEALAQNQATLTDAFFNDPQATVWSKLLATRMEVTCK